MRLLPLALLLACNGEDTADTEPITCDAAGTYDIEVTGRVADMTGANVSGAEVKLMDYGWVPGTELGSAVSEANGEFVLNAVGVTDVPDCWGTVLDYTLVATEGDRSGEKQINSNLHSAITDGSLNTDVTSFPIEIE